MDTNKCDLVVSCNERRSSSSVNTIMDPNESKLVVSGNERRTSSSVNTLMDTNKCDLVVSGNERSLWIAYLVDHRLLDESSLIKKIFCQALMLGDNGKVKELFSRYSGQEDRPVLECISYILAQQVSNCDDKMFLNFVNNTLKKCNLLAHQITEDQLLKLPVLQGAIIDEHLENENKRFEVFSKISSKAPYLWRVLAHFLIEYPKTQVIRINYSDDVKERMFQVLTDWYESNEPSKVTWEYLKDLLKYFGENNLVADIEEDVFGVPVVRDPWLQESFITVEDGREHIIFIKSKPGVLTYTAFKDTYENLDFSEVNILKNVNIVTKLYTTLLSFNEYSNKCRTFFADYFSIDFSNSMFNENIRFPPAYMCKSKIYDVAAKFELPNTVLITDYNLVEHCMMLNLDFNNICDRLRIDRSTVGEEDQTFLVFDYLMGCIFIIRHSEADSEEEALKDLKYAENFYRLFFYLFSQLLGTNLSYVNMVAAPNLENYCENFLILNKYDIYESDLENKLLDLHLHIPEITSKRTVPEKYNQSVIHAVSYIFGFLATRKVGPEFLFATVSERILSMWLTKEQLGVVFSKHLWRIVIGGYGSGKSVVTRYLLEHLVKHAVEPVDIYFVLFDSDTLFLKSLGAFIKRVKDSCNISKTNVFFGNCGDIMSFVSKELEQVCGSHRKHTRFTVSNVLLAITEKTKSSGRRFHLIIDELDSEVINSSEALALKSILKENGDTLKSSNILFSMRALEKRRTNVIGTKRVQHSSFQCYHDCGMKVMSLSLSMRTTKQVSRVIQISTEGITRPNKILQPNQKSHRKWSKFSRFFKSFQSQNTEPVSSKTAQSVTENTKPVGDKNFKSMGHRSSETNRSPTEGNKSVQHSNPDEIDLVALDCDKKYQGSNAAIETTFIFQQCAEIGHNIYGRQPVLIFLNQHEKEDLTSVAKAALLSIALKRHCYGTGRRKEKRMIICNEKDEFLMSISALTALEKKHILYIPGASDYQSVDEKSLESNTVITDYAGCRGMECSQVVVIMNPKEHFQRQFFLEMASRCTDHLVLIVPYHYDETQYGANERESVGHIVKKLCIENIKKDFTEGSQSKRSENNLLDVFSYVLIEDQDKYCPHAVTLYSNKSKTTTIKINKNHPHHKKYCPVSLSTELPSKPSRNVNAALSFIQPEPVKELQLEVLSEGLLELSWNHPGNKFQVTRTKLSKSTSKIKEEYEIIHPHFHVNKIQLPVEEEVSYKFIVHAISIYGGLLSAPAEIYHAYSNIPTLPSSSFTPTASPLATLVHLKEYTFRDLQDIINSSDVSSFQSILSTYPSIATLKDPGGTTPLMWASLYGNQSITRMLVHHGVDMAEIDSNGWTCLHYAVWYNRVNFLSYLLSIAPPDIINYQDDSDQTAIFHASQYGAFESVKLLLKYGADPHIQDNEGRTPYDAVCSRAGSEKTKRKIKKVLLQHEIQPSNSSMPTGSAFVTAAHPKEYTFGELEDMIFKQDSLERVFKTDLSIIEKRNASGGTLLMWASLLHNQSCVQVLLQHGVDIGDVDYDGYTCLHYCAMRNSMDCLSILLEIAPSQIIDCQNNYKQTALFTATEHGSVECIEILLKYNANPHIQDKDGRNPFDAACSWEGSEETKRRIKEVLLQRENQLSNSPSQAASPLDRVEE